MNAVAVRLGLTTTAKLGLAAAVLAPEIVIPLSIAVAVTPIMYKKITNYINNSC